MPSRARLGELAAQQLGDEIDNFGDDPFGAFARYSPPPTHRLAKNDRPIFSAPRK
jgi:hypothetical protein